jgi:hypothetical protein
MSGVHSEFDPEELAKITNRGMRTLSRANEPRISSRQISTLKETEGNEDKPSVQARRQLHQLLDRASAALKALFVRRQRKVVQCDNYGHVLRQGWTGTYPTCADCGKQITALDQVRGACVKEDSQSTSGNWKRVN